VSLPRLSHFFTAVSFNLLHPASYFGIHLSIVFARQALSSWSVFMRARIDSR